MKASGLVLILAQVRNALGEDEPLDNHGHPNLQLLDKFALDALGNLVFDSKQVLGATSSTLLLGNKWVNADPLIPARVIRSGNVVALDGLIKSGTVSATTVFATLPVGFRPARKVVIPVWTSGNAVGYVTINTNGQMQTTLFKAAGTALDGVHFIAA